MAYEPGSYTQELRQAHQQGEHAEQENDDCPACSFREVPEGFTSLAEFDEAVWETTLELQSDVDAHFRGEHKQRPVDACIECSQERA